MSEIERKLALERFRLLEPHLQNGRELRSVSEGSGVTFRTLQRWVANYKRQGLAGLVRKERTDAGERRTTSPRLREAIEGLALEKPPAPSQLSASPGEAVCANDRRTISELLDRA